jgi:GDP-L-fucose synthase
MEKEAKIYIAGHRGMVGSALLRRLHKEGYLNIVTRDSSQLDLRSQASVGQFFAEEEPVYVFMAAAKVGGIMANDTFRAEFIYDNLMIEANVINAAHEHRVKKLLLFGSSCIYPKLAPQPLKEEYLLSGPLELTNRPYAIAKIAGIELCDAYRKQHGSNFISAMPTNLYGPNDNYDLDNSHVLPALMRKFMSAVNDGTPTIEVWGTGSPLREFLHVDDLADASLFLMKHYNEPEIVNIGSGEELSILALARLIGKITGFKGEIKLNSARPDGTPRKLLDSSKLNRLGWQASISLEQGLHSLHESLKNKTWA